MDIKVTPLYEMIEGFLEEMNTIHAETTWERIAENADYDRYIVTRKQETVILHSDYGDTAFRIVEAPLENRIYVLSMGLWTIRWSSICMTRWRKPSHRLWSS